MQKQLLILSMSVLTSMAAYSETINYTVKNNSNSDFTIKWPLGCTSNLYARTGSYVSCTNMNKPGVIAAKTTVVCSVVKSGLPIACLGRQPCPVQLFPNNACSGSDVASNYVSYDGTFSQTTNTPGSKYHVSSVGSTVTINTASNISI